MKGFQVTILVTLMLFKITICQPGPGGPSKGGRDHSSGTSSVGSGADQSDPVRHFSGINLIQNGNFTVPLYEDILMHFLKDQMAPPWRINPQGWSVNARHENPDFNVDRAFLFGSPRLGQLGSSLQQKVTLGGGMYTFAFSYGLIGLQVLKNGLFVAQMGGHIVTQIRFIDLALKKAYFFESNIECKAGKIKVKFVAQLQGRATQRIMISNISLIKKTLPQQMKASFGGKHEWGDGEGGAAGGRHEGGDGEGGAAGGRHEGGDGEGGAANYYSSLDLFRLFGYRNKLKNGKFQFPPIGDVDRKLVSRIPGWKDSRSSSWLANCQRVFPQLSSGQAYIFTTSTILPSTYTLSQSFYARRPGKCIVAFKYGMPIESSKKGKVVFSVNGHSLVTIKAQDLEAESKYKFFSYFPCLSGQNQVRFEALDFKSPSDQIFVTEVLVIKAEFVERSMRKL